MPETFTLRDAIILGVLCSTTPCTPDKVVAWVTKHTEFKDHVAYAEIFRMMFDNVIKSTITLEIL